MSVVPVSYTCTCLFFPPGHRLVERYGLGAAAIRYAALGYAVIPLERGGKRPHRLLGDRGGVYLASRDPDIIKDWWSLDMAANVGVATGEVNRLAVVDLDVKGGRNGIESFYGFLASNAVRPGDYGLAWPDDTPVVVTPSGGVHLWLRWPDGQEVPERPGILPGVDVKGNGGLVVAPPSMRLSVPLSRPGEQRGGHEVPVPYEQGTGCPHWLPDAPAWMGGWLAFATPQPGGQRSEGSARGMPLDEALEGYLRSGIPEGMRNRELYRVACGLYRRYGTDTAGSQQVLATVRSVYDATAKGGFSWEEALTCVESARRFIETSRAREDSRNAEFLAWLERRHWS